MSTTSVRPATIPTVVLEPAAQALADALAADSGPPIYTLAPDDARAVLDRAQSGEIAMPAAEIDEHTVPGGTDGEISVTVERSVGAHGSLPTVVYTHGGGWILGNFATHERLVRDLTAQTGAAFVTYTPYRGTLSGGHRADVCHIVEGRQAQDRVGA